MGADFVEKATPSFRKSWDRARVALATADLFTRTPECAARSTVADIVGNAQLKVGEQLTVEPQDGTLIARHGNRVVARIAKPRPDLMQAVEDSCGTAKGTVQQVHALARVAEISLC